MIDRKIIIEKLSKELEKEPTILVLWLDGADATATVDIYSDIDFWILTKTGKELTTLKTVENIVNEIGQIDIKINLRHPLPGIVSKTFHLKNTSKYLLLDVFVAGEPMSDTLRNKYAGQTPGVIFDKIKWWCEKQPDKNNVQKMLNERRMVIKNVWAQYVRTESKLRRGLFLEASYYYHKWILAFLVELLRIKYCPEKRDYYLKHVDRDIPKKDYQRLEDLYKYADMDELEGKVKIAYKWGMSLIEDEKLWKK